MEEGDWDMSDIRNGDVAYRAADGKGTRLYARMPTHELNVQQYFSAVHKATTNPRCPYTMVWIVGWEDGYCWIKDEDKT